MWSCATRHFLSGATDGFICPVQQEGETPLDAAEARVQGLAVIAGNSLGQVKVSRSFGLEPEEHIFNFVISACGRRRVFPIPGATPS